jgi:hypothetical protein
MSIGMPKERHDLSQAVTSVCSGPKLRTAAAFSSIAAVNLLKEAFTMKTLRLGMFVLFALTLALGMASVGLAEDSKGKFKEALADKETFVVTEDGQDRTYQLDAKAKILINDRESRLNDLKAGDNVTVTWQLRNDRRVASMIACKRD